MANLVKSGELLLETIAYGDAAGLPVETLSALEIKFRYGWLNKLINVAENPFFIGEFGPGTWSDDTQLSLAVAEGLIEADGFDLEVQARHFMQAYRETPWVTFMGKTIPRGWGGSTTRSAQRLLEGVPASNSGESGVNEQGEAMGTGNGVIMKMAPLVLWQLLRGTEDAERYEQYDALTMMTHAHPIAQWASRLHGDMLQYLLLEDPNKILPTSAVASYILEVSRQHEASLGLSNEGTQSLAFLRNFDLRGYPERTLHFTDGKGFFVPQTLAMAYSVFLNGSKDMHEVVYQAVNLGGDTDSIASIVATMLNFYKKGDIILPDDAAFLQERERLQQVSRILTRTALKGANI